MSYNMRHIVVKQNIRLGGLLQLMHQSHSSQVTTTWDRGRLCWFFLIRWEGAYFSSNPHDLIFYICFYPAFICYYFHWKYTVLLLSFSFCSSGWCLVDFWCPPSWVGPNLCYTMMDTNLCDLKHLKGHTIMSWNVHSLLNKIEEVERITIEAEPEILGICESSMAVLIIAK